MECVDFTQLKWPSLTWVFEGASSITNSIFLLSSNVKRCARNGPKRITLAQSQSSHLVRVSPLDGLEIARLRLSAETVVLSACCSGQRPISRRGMQELPGDELFGLQAAFFRAGARRILGTLWPVASQVARQISTSFHSQLASGKCG